MTALERHRQAFPEKSDEWLFERLDNELKQKIEEIQRLIAENKVSPIYAKLGDYCAVCGCTEFWNNEM